MVTISPILSGGVFVLLIVREGIAASTAGVPNDLENLNCTPPLAMQLRASFGVCADFSGMSYGVVKA